MWYQEGGQLSRRWTVVQYLNKILSIHNGRELAYQWALHDCCSSSKQTPFNHLPTNEKTIHKELTVEYN